MARLLAGAAACFLLLTGAFHSAVACCRESDFFQRRRRSTRSKARTRIATDGWRPPNTRRPPLRRRSINVAVV